MTEEEICQMNKAFRFLLIPISLLAALGTGYGVGTIIAAVMLP